MKWPLAKRTTVTLLEEKLERSQERVKDRDRALAKLGHQRDQAYRDTVKLVDDLRVVRLHIDYGHGRSNRIAFTFTLADEILFDSFRRRYDFKHILVLMIEEAMWKSPEGQSLLAGRRLP